MWSLDRAASWVKTRRWRRMLRSAIWGAGIAVALCVFVALAGIFAARGFFGCGLLGNSKYSFLFGTADCIVQFVYKNVADPSDGEMPVTVTSYSNASHEVAVLGGGGEGLNCSLPQFAERLFTAPDDPDDHVNHRFRQACVYHDFCYRHGLATYGYTQSDCDRLLQEHSYRICLVAKVSVAVQAGRQDANTTHSAADRCQLEAKRFLFGVAFFGSPNFMGWNESSFFEFDPSPSRSFQFYTSRVIDHPFGSLPKTTPRAGDPQQFLLKFQIRRSGATVKCENCSNRTFELDELRESKVNLEPVSEREKRDLETFKSLRLGRERPIWLPALRTHAAPYLLSDGQGSQFFTWLNRGGDENTGACIVKAEPQKLLVHSRPYGAGCDGGSSGRLDLTSADILTSSPRPMLIPLPSAPSNEPKWDLVSVGLTNQTASRGVNVCIYSVAQDKKSCSVLHSAGKPIRSLISVFQNAVSISGNRATFFIRRRDKTHGHFLRVLSFEVNHPIPAVVTVDFDNEFPINDGFEPLAGLDATKNDLRFLSAKKEIAETNARTKAEAETLSIYEFEFRKDGTAKPLAVRWLADTEPLKPHASWARRPILVVEEKAASGAKTKFVLSRSRAWSPAEQPMETGGGDQLHFELAVLERSNAADGKPAALTYVGGASCDISYSFAERPFQDCLRTPPITAAPMRANSGPQAARRSIADRKVQGGARLGVRCRAGRCLHAGIPGHSGAKAH